MTRNIVISTKIQYTSTFDLYKGLEFSILTNTHYNQFGNLVENWLVIAHYDEGDKWHINYDLDDRSIYRVEDHMDRKVWKRIWGEYRRIQQMDNSGAR